MKRPEGMIFDLDGTLFSSKWRSELYDNDHQHEHYSGIPFDRLIVKQFQIMINAYFLHDIKIFFLTGRPEKYRMQTLSCFKKYNFPPGELYMRPNGFISYNSELKKIIYEEHIKHRIDILAAYDDHPMVIEMWKSIGIDGRLVEDPGHIPKIFGGEDILLEVPKHI